MGLDFLYEIIVGIFGATISGIILIHLHHRKVKQELEIHRKKDEFDRKQKIYKTILRHISRLIDHSHLLGKEVNWRITRQIYEELLIIGSPKVIETYNNFILNLNEISGKEEEHEKQKELWNVIRKDLYDVGLKNEEMHVISPPSETITKLDIYHNNAKKLKTLGITNLEKVSEMDVKEVSTNLGIEFKELESLKNMAIKEIQFENELKDLMKEKKIL